MFCNHVHGDLPSSNQLTCRSWTCLGFDHRVGPALPPHRNVDPVAIDPLPLGDDIAQVDAAAKPHAAMWRQLGISNVALLLDDDRAPHHLEHTGTLHQQVLPWGVHDTAPVLLDEVANFVELQRKGILRLSGAPHGHWDAESAWRPAIWANRGSTPPKADYASSRRVLPP